MRRPGPSGCTWHPPANLLALSDGCVDPRLAAAPVGVLRDDSVLVPAAPDAPVRAFDAALVVQARVRVLGIQQRRAAGGAERREAAAAVVAVHRDVVDQPYGEARG